MKKIIVGIVAIVAIIFAFNYFGDSNHESEFSKIRDISGYEQFIKNHPESDLVDSARACILRLKEEKRLNDLYGNYSLPNESTPYSNKYGSNPYYPNSVSHSEIVVKAPTNSDVVVIVRYNNENGRVAAHKYVRAGNRATLYLSNGTYQTFFYYGKGWCPEKKMGNGVIGGFLKDEMFSKDGNPVSLYNEILTYELVLQRNGNFKTAKSNQGEMF